MIFVRMLRKALAALVDRHRCRRLVEFDGSLLIQKYGPRAVARALEYDAQGQSGLSEGRRKGHWRRVARCIAARPLPVRTNAIFG